MVGRRPAPTLLDQSLEPKFVKLKFPPSTVMPRGRASSTAFTTLRIGPSDCRVECSGTPGNEALDYSVANREKPYFILGRYA
ncbi:hypothetical protein NDU88_001103 [Pleurodeles waltl]|uniref:Uncharacterized protein n=1 Tax=Pleurodeles waltl TaxID=8319 RepID=A0AAV7P2T5_PLEWA|nr:hypothetical protein NDU88_001103 [Pleurodeles waltl]